MPPRARGLPPRSADRAAARCDTRRTERPVGRAPCRPGRRLRRRGDGGEVLSARPGCRVRTRGSPRAAPVVAVRPGAAQRHRASARARFASVARLSLSGVQTIVMAAGEGRRLRPLTERWAKPVLPVGGRPVLASLLLELAAAALGPVAIVTGHLGHQLESLAGDGSAFGVEVRYARQ